MRSAAECHAVGDTPGRAAADNKKHLETLEENKLADVVAIEGNPLEDIRGMRRVMFMMKEGIVL